jgi:hypothetical protein
LNVVQSVLVKYPFTELVAAGIDTVPAVFTNGALNVSAPCLLLNVFQSVLDKYPLLAVPACVILIAPVPLL